MVNPSKSKDRGSFALQCYMNRVQKGGEAEHFVRWLEMLQDEKEAHNHKWDDPASRECNLEWDLLTTDWILEKVRTNKVYAQHLYAALCNNDFQKLDTWMVLKGSTWGCSWRHAGGVIADMRQEGDYIDWYCSGITEKESLKLQLEEELAPERREFICRVLQHQPEGVVTDEIREDLHRLGWIVKDDPV